MSWIDATQAPDGDRMTEVATEINRNYARFCDLLYEADHAQEWLADGSPNVTQWLNARYGIQPSFGRRLARLAHRLSDLPELRKRFAAGEISMDAADVISEMRHQTTKSI